MPLELLRRKVNGDWICEMRPPRCFSNCDKEARVSHDWHFGRVLRSTPQVQDDRASVPPLSNAWLRSIIFMTTTTTTTDRVFQTRQSAILTPLPLVCCSLCPTHPQSAPVLHPPQNRRKPRLPIGHSTQVQTLLSTFLRLHNPLPCALSKVTHQGTRL